MKMLFLKSCGISPVMYILFIEMAVRAIYGRLLHLAVLAPPSGRRVTGVFARGILTHALGPLPLLLGLRVVPPLSGYLPRGSLIL